MSKEGGRSEEVSIEGKEMNEEGGGGGRREEKKTRSEDTKKWLENRKKMGRAKTGLGKEPWMMHHEVDCS